jgi:polysaccharide export outer membrane protein
MHYILKKSVLILSLVVGFTCFAYSQDFKEEAKRHYQIGNFYYQQGRYKEAKEEFKKALDLLSQERAVPGVGVVQPEVKVEQPEVKGPVVEYVIGQADTLYISIWQNPDLDQEVIVRPDGMVSFPLAGDIPAAGLTISQFDRELTERLKEYIKYPEVSISIKKLGGKKVIVLGQVDKPGVYSVTGARTILEAIGLAGGFTNDAVSSSVVLIRGGFTNPEAKRINLTKAIDRGDLRLNVALESEDIVFVPKKFIANLNYFLKQILDPISKGVYTAREINNW